MKLSHAFAPHSQTHGSWISFFSLLFPLQYKHLYLMFRAHVLKLRNTFIFSILVFFHSTLLWYLCQEFFRIISRAWWKEINEIKKKNEREITWNIFQLHWTENRIENSVTFFKLQGIEHFYDSIYAIQPSFPTNIHHRYAFPVYELTNGMCTFENY